MRLYLAGNVKTVGASERDHATGARNRLLSYAFLHDWAKDEFAFWVEHQPPGVNVFLDSGAFSAHTLGRKIDLGAYCAYVEKHAAALAAYAVLDVIGDEHGTRRNTDAMRQRGLDPVTIYHVGSAPLSVLDGLLADLGPSRYMALGGMASERATREELQAKLDACWSRVERHWPVKLHGLGVLSQWALERYPWYSTDGSSAIVAAGMGRVNRFLDRADRHAPPLGEMSADGWRDDVRLCGDGLVADGIGRVREAGGRSDSAHEGRRVRNIQAQLALERYVTDLWRMRGVSWEETR